MSEATAYRVLGALGPGPTSPLLADALVDEREVDRVVLSRPGRLEVEAALRKLGSTRFVVPIGQADTDRGVFAVLPFVPGADLDGLRVHHGGPLPDDAARALLFEVVTALQRATEVGISHGDLSPPKVRVDPDGSVRLLGARGGDESGDVRGVHELAQALTESDDGVLPDAFHEEGWPTDLAGLAERLGGSKVELRALLPDSGPALHPHALAGTVLAVRRPGAGTPPKVQIAAVGAITLVLGLGAGWALAGWGLAPSPAGGDIELECAVQGDLDAGSAGKYLCVREEGGLRCTER